MSKRKYIKQDKLEQQQAIAQAQSEFFGEITKPEAIDVFKTLAILVQFPGANPPELLTDHEVIWTSTMKVGDSLNRQVFSVMVIYKGLSFIYTANRDRTIQLRDGTFINFDTWDYWDLLIANRVLGE